MALAGFAANGDVAAMRGAVERGEPVDSPGADGTTPLCAAVMWGQEGSVMTLLELGANVNALSSGSMTALHAACLQEDGKMALLLLNSGGDPLQPDGEGVTPADYASCSDAVWPLFASKGVPRTGKQELLAKKVIRKTIEEETPQQAGFHGQVAHVSRPGSSYVVAKNHPEPRGRQTPKASRPIDILADVPEDPRFMGGTMRRGNLSALS